MLKKLILKSLGIHPDIEDLYLSSKIALQAAEYDKNVALGQKVIISKRFDKLENELRALLDHPDSHLKINKVLEYQNNYLKKRLSELEKGKRNELQIST